ncbi:MAG: tetratricopeptide repeat protein [Halieaceae bacterium]
MNTSTAELNQQAILSYGSGLLVEAIQLWRQVLEQSSDNWEVMVYLASALKETGDLDAAAHHYEQALVIQPGLAEVHYNLGNIRQSQGFLDEAARSYRDALALKPDFAFAVYNLGNVVRDQGQLQLAIDCYKQAILLAPQHAPSYNNLGNALKHQGQLDVAIQCYRAALENQPDYADAMYNLGNALFEQQDFAAALPWFDDAGIRDAQSRALYCIYKCRRFEEFEQRLASQEQQLPHHSPQVATLAAHNAINFGRSNNYRFCPQPFDLVYQQSLPELAGAESPLRSALLADIAGADIEEKTQGRLHHGVQSAGNLFYRSEVSFRTLADLVRQHFDQYLQRYRDLDCELIHAFPAQREFESSWYIRMRQGGHLTSHIHEGGWVSGVVYLALPQHRQNPEEGCFELGLDGDDYPVEPGAGEFPSKVLPINVGDIVLFPANLFHRTIPFSADEERICIAFDLKPGV